MRLARGSIGMVRVATFLAALVLVLQTATAFAAPPVQRDIFGNIICAQGSTGESPTRGGHDGGHLPDCCMLACGAAFQPLADLPPVPGSPRLEFVEETIAFPSPAIPVRQPRRTPANPRAPPLAA